MGRKTSILLTVWIGFFVFTFPAGAQDEQWLQYHSEREANRMMPDMQSSTQNAVTDKPEGVKLPEFKTQKPYFVRWTTPMVASGGLWIALDRSSEQGKPDLLYIDSNANGHLDDEEIVKAYQTEQYYTYFGPVKVVFDTEDGPVTYHLNLRFMDYNDLNRRMYIYSGGWYEGEITVAGKKKYCVLIDHNANGTFNDKSLQSGQCDRIQIDRKDRQEGPWVGNYIQLDGVFYNLEVSRDGAFVKLAKAEDMKFGTIRVPETITELAAGGENGLFTFQPDKGVGKLPTGKYRVDHWQIDRKDEKGTSWTLQGTYLNERGDFEITEGAEASLEIGEPVTASLSVRLNGENYEFSKSLKGPLGEYVSLSASGREINNLWKMKAGNEEGTYEKLYPIPDQ
ncbi:MAG: hypothetical protein A2Z25_23790 [Planctomycetes bacterium RBG_16_55_9]|nr:MAG: hypothetical protein A2Z25_23790 [Planctomycetes bacterium RBG_16_55_9]